MRKDEITVEDVMLHRVDRYRFGEGSPRVLITGGLHGGETTGQYAAYRMIDEMKKRDPAGEVTIMPRCNPAAFRGMRRSSPYDEQDMNRIFPGRTDGTSTEALASQIWDIAQDMDYIVDLHCCGLYGTSYTLAQYEDHDFARDLAQKIDIPLVVQSAGARGQLFVEAGLKGIPSVIIELPGGGRTGIVDLGAGEETVSALINMLALLGILPGEEGREPDPVFSGKLRMVRCAADGLFLPRIAPGKPFEEGQVLGALTGEQLSVDFPGHAMIVRPPGYVFRGATVLVLAPGS